MSKKKIVVTNLVLRYFSFNHINYNVLFLYFIVFFL